MGEYTGRIIQLPQKEESEFIITKGLNHTLLIFREEEWDRFREWMFTRVPLKSRNGRVFARTLQGSAIVAEANEDGEIAIPEALWEYLMCEKEGKTAKVYNAKEYLEERKDDILLEHASFIVVGQEYN